MKRRTGIVLGVALVFATATAWAQSDESARRAARDLGNRGIELYEQADYKGAEEALGRAYAVMPVPTLGLWYARALSQNGKLVEASERFHEVSRATVEPGAAEVVRQAVAEAATEHAALQSRIPSLTITLAAGEATSGIEITIDGNRLRAALLGVPIAVNPGEHTFVVTREGKTLRGKATTAEGEKKAIELTFKTTPEDAAPVPPAAAAAPAEASVATTPADAATDSGTKPGKGQRIAGFATLGVGVVGLGVGGFMGAQALRKKSDLDTPQACIDDRCATWTEEVVNEYNDLRTGSTVGFIVGGVGVAGGVVLLLTAPKTNRSGRSIQPWIGGTSAGVSGRF